MAIVLEKLQASGIGLPDASLTFRPEGTLIRGPSDTGKSYIRDCLWYLLGGDRVPKEIPQSLGYQTLLLQFRSSEANVFTIRRALSGGGIELFPCEIEDIGETEPLPDDIGEFFVSLAGAKGKQILRSMSKRGSMTGGDLRHWFLWSQPTMISESPTTGTPTEQPQRRAAFCVFLTGQDDSAVVLAPTKDEKLKVKTIISSIDENIKRVTAEIHENSTKDDIKSTLERLDNTLSLLSKQQMLRSKQLHSIRESFVERSTNLKVVEEKLAYSSSMASRFNLLDRKYASDYDRLSAMGDAVAVFDTLDNQRCPLCGTGIERQVDQTLLSKEAAQQQRSAMLAEAKKIGALREGLTQALSRETKQVSELSEIERRLRADLERISKQEQQALTEGVQELSADPKTLAVARTEFSAQLSFFNELERLNVEREKLENITPSKTAALSRQTVEDSIDVSKIVIKLLHEWGLSEIQTIVLDATECDIQVNGRARLSYGAGKRAIFLAAMSIALLTHAMSKKYPHLGLVVIDSPIKTYTDPKNSSDVTVSPVTVRDSFYNWLSRWDGPGQIIVLENEPISNETAEVFGPIEFTGSPFVGRQGFYPVRGNS
jgi:hypothetical protein